MQHVCPMCGLLYAGPGSCPTDGAQLTLADDPMLGQQIGNYRVTRLMGAGGMGRVYAAVQPSIGARVAIKVLAPEYASNPEVLQRFFAEARAVNLIRHENIVNILDMATMPNGQAYIVMEHLDGAPLSSVIERNHPLPLGTLVGLISEVLAALAAAHEKGIVHRDLKPDNIFVTPAGHAEVLDFGIAKLDAAMAGHTNATKAGIVQGTPMYMSPEQATARPQDARSDLYSIGIILYEATTGKVPFNADSTFEILRMHVQDMPAPPRGLRPDLPPAFEAVIMRAAEKDPARRFASASEMAAALTAAIQGLPAEAFTPLRVTAGGPVAAAHNTNASLLAARTGATTAAAPRKRGGLYAALAGAVVAAAVAAAVVVARSGGATPQPQTLVAAVPAPEPSAPAPAPTPAPDPEPTPTPAPVAAVAAPAPEPAPAPAEVPAEAASDVPRSGIPECDEYISKFLACMKAKMPASAHAQTVDGLRTAAEQWAQYNQPGQLRDTIAKGCTQASQQAKKAMASLGCTW